MTKFFRTISIFIILSIATNDAKAQFVTIPDLNFANWLNSNNFSICMNGNQLDTTCSYLLSVKSLYVNNLNILNLTGISFFDSLEFLHCEFNKLFSFPKLPESLKELHCQDNYLTSLPDLPPNLVFLSVMNNNLNALPTNLPSSLTTLNFSGNNVSVLPSLPSGLINLYFFANSISSVPVLPDSLTYLNCSSNNLSALPSLPNGLVGLQCFMNSLSSIPSLPNTLKSLVCYNNLLDSLPSLHEGLETLFCSNNQLQLLPILPKSLVTLKCENNFLTTIPPLYWNLTHLSAQDNLLTSIQRLPSNMPYMNISNNFGLHCIPPVARIGSLYWGSTNINCLPNRVNIGSSTPSVSTLPVCDFINLFDCPVNWNIKGVVYLDEDSNCVLSLNEPVVSNVKVGIFSNGNLVKQTITNSFGEYFFKVDTGTYIYSVDTLSTPYSVNCPDSFNYSSTLTSSTKFYKDNDFSLFCKNNNDIGVVDVKLDDGVPRPGALVSITISAGDMSGFFGFQCATGISGTVTVVLQGPANFVYALPGALVPNVSGDTLTYSILDFGTLNFNTDFSFAVSIDTLSLLGDQICFNVIVSPIAGDIQPLNNTYSHCFEVVNSYDPNDKAVNPIDNIDISRYDLTYTIRFQNTGNVPAIHVRIADTLSPHIDQNSFQLLSYSHEPLMQITGRNIMFNFPFINLPDSVNNEPASHGFVQYRVKRKNNLPIGTQIQNTAYIYFDFNPPIQTNTTVNEIAITSGVGVGENQNPILFSIFPNPVSSGQILNIYFNSSEKRKAEMSLYDLSGRKLFAQFVNASEQSQVVALPNISPGVYLVVLNDGKYQAQQKFIVLK